MDMENGLAQMLREVIYLRKQYVCVVWFVVKR